MGKGSASRLSKKAKVSRGSYEKGIKIKSNDSNLWNKCLNGEISIDKGYKKVNHNKIEQERKENAKKGEKIKLTDKDCDLRLGISIFSFR